MVENYVVIELIFAESFVSQDFTVRAAPGLCGPANIYDSVTTVFGNQGVCNMKIAGLGRAHPAWVTQVSWSS